MSQLPVQSTSTGLAPNLAGALAYVLGPITGILFLVIEKESNFVRFHAAQSIVVSVAMIALSIVISIIGAVLSVIPILGVLIGLAMSMGLALASFALWLMLMFRAYSGQEWEAPLIGHHSRKLIATSAMQ